MKLAKFTVGRDNNFNLIRIIAAFAVLVTHSFALGIGTGDAEPFRESLGMTLGALAVDIFFITSGFLVTASLLTRQSVIEFIWARILRIFPALLVMLLLTVFLLGLIFTSLSPQSYLTDSATYYYLMKCGTLMSGVAYRLPGVFEGNPYKGAINGSLWTMPYEVMMYAILAAVWISLFVVKKIRLRIFQSAIVISSIIAFVLVIVRHFYLPAEGQFVRLYFMFFTGAAFYVLKDYITLFRSLFWALVGMLAVSAFVEKEVFFIVYMATIAYILFYIAYVPSGIIRKYNQLGDYSYGTYIYAFPIQQSIVAMVPGISVLSLFLLAAPATLLMSALSWHFLERRALSLKKISVDHTKKIFANGFKSTATRLSGDALTPPN